MTRSFRPGAALLCALLLPLPAAALDVPIYEDQSDGQAANCSVGTVMGLKAGGDGFLAVRSGPGSEHAKIGELHNGDKVTIFGREDGWYAILVPGGQIDQADACGRAGPRRQVTGGGLGWAHGNWIGNIIP
ncbi:SH3 domain-containing protein [Mangrovicoccus sp. HB161399]|uniref:SH3 domain-containing protein n=1 Tax=Mangrovicoccus sp. HB161399 TaxID=2720392 RepID=UPI0015557431|nr:SH3 domain-containing protein [Mangrovicoccus sp. HB161399]